jgi:hypothetical protein
MKHKTTNSQREISRSIKIIDADYLYVPKSLDDVIKTCQNFHGEVQSQELIPIYEHLNMLFDGTLREFDIEQMAISLQLMNSN